MRRIQTNIAVVLLLLSLACNIWLLRENRQLLAVWGKEEQAALQVHVTGAVAIPGVYNLDRGCRVTDALTAAGGALENALLASLNLAKPLFDGEQVHVAQALPASSPIAENPFATSGLTTQLVNLNTATIAELQTLPGIGPAKAQAIIDYRQQNGAFARIEDITRVSGIGDKTFAKLKHLIVV